MSIEPLHQHSRPRCVMCARDLEPGARRCTHCEAFQDVRQCPSCDMPTPRHSARCAYCHTVENGKACRVCGASIGKKAIRCSECQSFQNWRRWVPASQVTLALLISLVSLGSATVPHIYRHYTNHSETHVRVLRYEPFLRKGAAFPEPSIVVLVMNTGKRPSLVKSALLQFDKKGPNAIHATDATLEVADQDVVVKPDEPMQLHFTGGMLGRRDGKTKKDVLDEVQEGRRATLVVTVEETNRNGKQFDAPVPHTFNADKIDKWMDARVSEQ